MSQEAYDIVIVGAGAAGCVVASHLAEHTDASIALIEAGDMDRDPFIHNDPLNRPHRQGEAGQ